MKTKVVHSQSKTAFNVIGAAPGGKYKIARVPYLFDKNALSALNDRWRKEAYSHARFISECFNKSKEL